MADYPDPVFIDTLKFQMQPIKFPSDIDGITAWWDPDTLDDVDGQDVNLWQDRISALTLEKGGTAPVYKRNIVNGKPIVRFSGAGWLANQVGWDMTDLLDNAADGEGTIIAVVNVKSVGGTDTIWSQGNLGIKGYMYAGATGVQAAHYDGSQDVATLATTTAQDTFIILMWLKNVAGVFVGLVQDPTSWDSLTNAASGAASGLADSFIVGALGTAALTTMDLAELVCYNQSLNKTERQFLSKYFADKYRIPNTSTEVWEDLDDIQVNDGISIRRGIPGTSYRDRVASTGSLTFGLDNSEDNSVGLLGYYSPNNVNRREGWGIGTGIRCRVDYDNLVDEDLFVGRISSITPLSGKYRQRKVKVTCVDWMEEATTTKVSGLEVLYDVRADQIFEELVEQVSYQPVATLLGIGADEYPYALDNALEELNLMTEFQKLGASEQGYIFVARNGWLILEGRHKRPNQVDLDETLTDSDLWNVSTGRGRRAIVNRAEVQVHPRRVDASATSVLFVLASLPKIVAETRKDIKALYRDPDARATRVGGDDMVTPVATTDYTFHQNQDGTGADYTAQITVDVEYFANSAVITVYNAGPKDGFLTKLQLRGRGIYSYETVIAAAQNIDSKEFYGENVLPVDMPYQSDITVAKDAADYIVNQGKAVYTPVDKVTFIANREDRLMRAAITLDVSSKVRVEETMVGTDAIVPIGETEEVAALNFFINHVNIDIVERGIMMVTWTLVPADPFGYWILERDGYTELNETTRLAYGSFQAGWVLDFNTLGTDTRVNQ